MSPNHRYQFVPLCITMALGFSISACVGIIPIKIDNGTIRSDFQSLELDKKKQESIDYYASRCATQINVYSDNVTRNEYIINISTIVSGSLAGAGGALALLSPQFSNQPEVVQGLRTGMLWVSLGSGLVTILVNTAVKDSLKTNPDLMLKAHSSAFAKYRAASRLAESARTTEVKVQKTLEINTRDASWNIPLDTHGVDCSFLGVSGKYCPSKPPNSDQCSNDLASCEAQFGGGVLRVTNNVLIGWNSDKPITDNGGTCTVRIECRDPSAQRERLIKQTIEALQQCAEDNPLVVQ